MKKVIVMLFVVIVVATGQEIGARYLIITHDNYYNSVLPLAEWKTRKGILSKTVRLSQIGADSISIRNYIINAYTNWTIRPEYLLLVGAPNYLPLPMIRNIYSDNYYTNMDGDIYNEILSGRLTVRDTIQAQTVVNKILAYERTPYRPDTLWFNKGCLLFKCEFDQDDSIYWSDLLYAAGLMNAAHYAVIDTFSDSLGDNRDSLLNAVNDGRSIVMYRGSATNNWPSPFDLDPDLTQNGLKLPIVLSITCRTWGTGSTPAVAEKWLLTGTPSTPRGASGYFATTTEISSGAFLRSAVARGFFDALFINHAQTFGAACEGARTNVYQMYQYQGGIDEFLGFTTLGDPEMNLWTDTPCSLNCYHPATISVGSVDFTVRVHQAADSQSVPGARVCIMGRLDTTVYSVQYTDSSGSAYFPIEPHFIDDTVFVTATGTNLQPYEGFMITKAAGARTIYLKSLIDDIAGGNGDAVVNPGEEINLPTWVKNHGDSVGINISGGLSVNDTFLSVTDSLKSFGDIPGHDSAFTGMDGYNFTVNSGCPDGHLIRFALTCHDINDSIWVSHFSIPVHSPRLLFQEAQISGGNGNNTFEPGETVTVVVTVMNQGSIAADSIVALLRTFSPNVVITDSSGFFGSINPDSSADNGSDPFVIYADSATPQGTYADFNMIVRSGQYSDTLPITLIIGKKDYFIWNPDPTPASGVNIHIILDSLGYNGDYDTVLTANLNPYRYGFVCAGIFPNNYVVETNRPEAERLVDYVQNGGCLYLEGGDIWYYDPLGGGYNFNPLFGINAIDDGAGDLGPVTGQPATFTESMQFSYAGENRYIDHIYPDSSGSFLIFLDTDNNYGCGVAHNGSGYRTVGLSFELSSLVDSVSPSTRAVLLDSIIYYFSELPGIEESGFPMMGNKKLILIYPNPCRGNLHIQYHPRIENVKVSLKIFDIAGRCVKNLFVNRNLKPTGEVISWSGKDNLGRKVPAGVYFVRFESPYGKETTKVIFLK